jgi:hypothetical protein
MGENNTSVAETHRVDWYSVPMTRLRDIPDTPRQQQRRPPPLVVAWPPVVDIAVVVVVVVAVVVVVVDGTDPKHFRSDILRIVGWEIIV